MAFQRPFVICGPKTLKLQPSMSWAVMALQPMFPSAYLGGWSCCQRGQCSTGMGRPNVPLDDPQCLKAEGFTR